MIDRRRDTHFEQLATLERAFVDAAAAEPIPQLRSVGQRFGTAPLVDGVSPTVRRGEAM